MTLTRGLVPCRRRDMVSRYDSLTQPAAVNSGT